MAHVFTVKSNANRKIRATIEQHPHLTADDFTVEPAGGGFVVRMTVRNAADQEVALNRGFEFAVSEIETLSLGDGEAVEKAISKGTFAGLKQPTQEEWEATQQEAEAPEAELDLPDTFRLGGKAAAPAAEPERFETRGKAQVAAFARGLGVFTIRKADGGGYVIDENARPEPRAQKARKAKAGKAAPAPEAAKAAKAAKPAKAAAGPGKFAAIREAAERGELPPAPDFSADLHKRNRGRLAQLVAMAEAGDVAGLEAFPIKPNCTSPKAMDRYRNLCVIALKTRAAKPEA